MIYYEHPFPPIFNAHTRLLILGSFPSVASRENNFYYAHPRNRFWKIMACLTQTYPFPAHVHEKVFMLLKNKIALWDVVQRCTINGSQDGTINNVIPVNLSLILENSHSQYIFTNGSKAHSLYNQYLLKDVAIEAQKLPSTSPANATYNLEQLLQKWRIIMDYL